MADIEFERPEVIKAYQEGLLAEALQYLSAHSKYYQRMFESYRIDISKIRTLEDLVKIPFTEKKDLQLFNDDFLCCPKEKIVDYVTTSGTLGDPVTFGCTDKDLDRLAFNEKKSFACAGIQPGDIVQLMTTIDKRFMAGLAYFLGIRALGASIIRVGNGIPELQWDTIRRIKPDTIMCVPSFILRLIQYAEEHDIDYKNYRIILFCKADHLFGICRENAFHIGQKFFECTFSNRKEIFFIVKNAICSFHIYSPNSAESLVPQTVPYLSKTFSFNFSFISLLLSSSKENSSPIPFSNMPFSPTKITFPVAESGCPSAETLMENAKLSPIECSSSEIRNKYPRLRLLM